MENDTLISKTGFKIYKGQVLEFGTGSTDDGDFKFIRRNSTGFGTAMTTTNNYNYNKMLFSLPRNMAGHTATVVKMVERGTKKSGFVYQPLVTSGGGLRYEIDVDNAINAGELKVPDEFMPKKNQTGVVIQQEVSVADELRKIKSLYDEGVLTKEEYEAQKAKLLAK